MNTTIHDILSTNGLDYAVETRPVHVGGLCPERYKATVLVQDEQDHEVLGINGSKYVPINPATAFGWLGDLSTVLDLPVECVDAGRFGPRAWVRLRLGKAWARADVGTTNDDPHDLELFVVDTYDGTSQLTGTLRQSRLVCSNGMRLLTDVDGFKVRHTNSAESKLNTATTAIMRAVNDHLSLGIPEQSNWKTVRMFDNQAELAYARVLGGYSSFYDAAERLRSVERGETRNVRHLDRVMRLWRNGNGAESTIFGWVQGLTNYLTHEHGRSAGHALAWTQTKYKQQERATISVARRMYQSAVTNGSSYFLTTDTVV